jgi:hypothetical protein
MGDEHTGDAIDRAIEWFNANPGPRQAMTDRLMAEYKLTHTQAVRILAACKYDEALARRALEGKMEG